MCLPLIHFSTMLTEAYLQPVHVCTHMYVGTNKLRGAAKIFTLSEPSRKMWTAISVATEFKATQRLRKKNDPPRKVRFISDLRVPGVG